MNRLLIALFALAFITSTLWDENIVSEVSAVATPQNEIENYRLYSNGGGSNPSIHWNGDKFTLTENIEGSITIESDNVEFDGGGFTVKGRGSSNGIVAYDRSNVTVKNVNVENFQTGILLGHYSPDAFLWYDPNPNRCTNCTISNCVVSNNTIGISIAGGIKCKIMDNQATNNSKGIIFSGSENVFKNNHMKNNSINFQDASYKESNVDSSNAVDGKPIYYLVNEQNMTVPIDASMVVLINCVNISVQGLNLSHMYEAIVSINTNNSKIYGNSVTDNQRGIVLQNSFNIKVSRNHLLNNLDDAIEQHNSENITISNNLIRANGEGIGDIYAATSRNTIISDNQIIENAGWAIKGTTKCSIMGNYIFGNGGGIHFYELTNSIISENNITENYGSGIFYRTGTNTLIANNSISQNRVGIWFGDPSKNIITHNDFTKNVELAIQIDGYAKDNLFFLNNFVGNNNQSIQASIKGVWVYKGDEGYNENSSVFPQYIAGYANAWDDGSAGNYWSDYNQTADEGGYRIDKNNIDKHPQSAPLQLALLDIPEVELEAPQPSSPFGEQSSGSFTIVTAIVALAVGIVCAVLLVKNKKFFRKKVG